jgi:hypothetical protein
MTLTEIVGGEAKRREQEDTPRMAEQVGLTQLVGSWRLVSLGATYTDTKDAPVLVKPIQEATPGGFSVMSS